MQGQLPFKRLCIQSLCYPQLEEDLIQLIHTFKEAAPSVPISVAIPPQTQAHLIRLKQEGVDRVAISIDAATPEIFNAIKGSGVNGPFTWKEHFRALELALSIFGPNRTTTHLIVGLGEYELEAVNLIQRLTDQGITIGLFP